MFGAWVHGGIFGITKRTLNHTRLCKYLNEFISHSSPKRFTWTSFVFYFNGKARLHVDKYKLKDSYNITFSFGEYTRGALWIQGANKLGDHRRTMLTTKVFRTEAMMAQLTAKLPCSLCKPSTPYNPIQANATLYPLSFRVRQTGKRQERIAEKN